MSRVTVSNPATPIVSAGTPRVSPNAEKATPAEQASKGAWAHDRIARRAYELYEERRAAEDWVKAEC